nr:sperm acrosome membrane-associated protein 4-like [Anolis sagrei ordinatus]
MDKRAAATLFFTLSFFQIASCQQAVMNGLQCYKCKFDQPCSDPSSVVSCQEGEVCGFIKGNSEYKVHEPIFGTGCIEATKCSSDEKIIHSSNPFRVSYSCCNTNYCNNGNSRFNPSRTHLTLLFVATLSTILLTFLIA